nr:hypothetical protein [Tanacetum cinerariifolium]
MDQNNDSSHFDQIQSLRYPIIHHSSQTDVEEMLQDKEKFMHDTKTFLEKFSRISFDVIPRVLSIAWERFSEINDAYLYKRHRPEKIKELMCKLLEDVRNIKEELAEYINSPKKSPNGIAPILSTEEPEYSLSMEYEHLNTTPETKSDKVIESSVENLLPIPSEYEVTFKDKNECDVPVYENSLIFDDHSEIFFDSNNDDISSDDDAFEDVEYVEATPLDPKLVILEEENDVYQEDAEFNLEDIQDVILRDKLLSINRLIVNIESLNDNPTLDCVLNSSTSFPIFEEFDNSLSLLDNSSPVFDTFSYHTEETRSCNTTTLDSLPEYDSFCFEIEPD